MARYTYGAGPKPRRRTEKVNQNTDNVYGGNNGANRGKSYTKKNNPTDRGNRIDNLQGEKKERRGRRSTGTTKFKSKTTGQKARSRNANKRNKAKG